MPELHTQVYRGREFIEALTECKDLDFFTLKTVQIIIDHHYAFWYKFNIVSQVVPAVLNVIVFWAWNNLILPIRVRELELQKLERETAKTLDKDGNYVINPETHRFGSTVSKSDWNVGELDDLSRQLNIILTVYLLCNEAYIMFANIGSFTTKDLAAAHFLQNLLFVILTLQVLLSIYRADDDNIMTDGFWSFQCWVSLFIWTRLLFQYLKEIKEFSWTVGLIVNSIASTG